MDAPITVALSQLIKKPILEAARAKIEPGEYQVNTVVRVDGSIIVEPDYQTAPTVSIPLKATLALFVRYAGITRDHAIAHLTRAMTEAVASDTKGETAILAECPEIAETIVLVQERILATLPRPSRKGRVRAFLTMTEVGEEQ